MNVNNSKALPQSKALSINTLDNSSTRMSERSEFRSEKRSTYLWTGPNYRGCGNRNFSKRVFQAVITLPLLKSVHCFTASNSAFSPNAPSAILGTLPPTTDIRSPFHGLPRLTHPQPISGQRTSDIKLKATEKLFEESLWPESESSIPFGQEWQAAGKNSAFINGLNALKNQYTDSTSNHHRKDDHGCQSALLLQKDIFALREGSLSDALLPSENDALKKAVDLTQFSSGRIETPMAVVLIGPDSNFTATFNRLSELVGPFVAIMLIERFAFNAEGNNPQSLGVDLSPIFTDLLHTLNETLKDNTMIKWLIEFSESAKALGEDTPLTHSPLEPPNNSRTSINDLCNALSVLILNATMEIELTEAMSQPLYEALADTDAFELLTRTTIQQMSERTGELTRQTLFKRMSSATHYGIQPNYQTFYDSSQPLHLSIHSDEPTLNIDAGVDRKAIDAFLGDLFPIIFTEEISDDIRSRLMLLGNMGESEKITKQTSLSLSPLVRMELERLLSATDIENQLFNHSRLFHAVKESIIVAGQEPDGEFLMRLKPALLYFNQLKCGEIVTDTVESHMPSPALMNQNNIKTILSSWIAGYQACNLDDPLSSEAVLQELLDEFFPNSSFLM